MTNSFWENEGAEENMLFRNQVEQLFQNGGDKHRLTLINMSCLENWFDPKEIHVFHILLAGIAPR